MKKALYVFLTIVMVGALLIMPASAGNSDDTLFSFRLKAGQKDVSDYRPKYEESTVYAKTYSVPVPFELTAVGLGPLGQPVEGYANIYVLTGPNQTILIQNTLLQNGYYTVALEGIGLPSPYEENTFTGVWSPDTD